VAATGVLLIGWKLALALVAGETIKYILWLAAMNVDTIRALETAEGIRYPRISP
jgi:hypothetical protein